MWHTEPEERWEWIWITGKEMLSGVSDIWDEIWMLKGKQSWYSLGKSVPCKKKINKQMQKMLGY